MRKLAGVAAVAICLAGILAACKGSTGAAGDRSTSPSSASAAAASSPPASSPVAATSPATSPGSSVSTAPQSPLSSTLPSPAASSAAASSSPPAAAATPISVSVAKINQPIPNGAGGTATIQQPTTHGLSAAVDAALRAPAVSALAAFEKDLKSDPCTQQCTPADYLAQFAVTRSDSAIVSGTWTILTYFPGGAHPETVLDGVIVRATDGATIAPAQLFAADDLSKLAAPLQPALTAQLNSRGCIELDPGDVAAATSASADNYQGVAVTPSGVLVGFSDDEVAAHACGTFDVPVSWSAVHSGLSPFGLAIAARSSLPAAATPVSRCSTGVLELSFGSQRQIAVGQFQLEILFTNIASEACFLQGFPGLDLTGERSDGTPETISLPRTSAAPTRITVTAGGSAHAELTYLVGPDSCDPGGTAWTPDAANVTPPDATVTSELFWTYNSVDDCQTGATHPGTYIGPVVAGS